MTEAELLFTELLQCERAELYLDRARKLDIRQSKLVADALRRRIDGEPLQYILGKAWFMGLELRVNDSVLIPRPETEILVETCIRYAGGNGTPGTPLRVFPIEVLELGTGSGCIAVTLAKSLPGSRVTAVDISWDALVCAAENARMNDAEVELKHSDLFSALGQRKFDIIVSNPPYVRSGDIDGLEPELKREPRMALDGGKDGLDFYRRIAVRAAGFLKKGGLLLLETGYDQAASVRGLLEESEDFVIRETVRDYAGIERVVVASTII